jgi:hypothetical protein
MGTALITSNITRLIFSVKRQAHFNLIFATFQWNLTRSGLLKCYRWQSYMTSTVPTSHLTKYYGLWPEGDSPPLCYQSNSIWNTLHIVNIINLTLTSTVNKVSCWTFRIISKTIYIFTWYRDAIFTNSVTHLPVTTVCLRFLHDIQ